MNPPHWLLPQKRSQKCELQSLQFKQQTQNDMNIKGINKALLLAALYNASRVQGMGWLQAKPGQMDEAWAQRELDQSPDKYFDYLHGKVMKVSLAGDELDSWIYDRDNGQGAAERAVKHLLG